MINQDDSLEIGGTSKIEASDFINRHLGIFSYLETSSSMARLDYPATLGKWLKRDGDYVFKDERICNFYSSSSKFSATSPWKISEASPSDGVLHIISREGKILEEGEIFYIVQENPLKEQERFKLEIHKTSVEKINDRVSIVKCVSLTGKEIWATITKNEFEEYLTVNIGPPTTSYFFHDIYSLSWFDRANFFQFGFRNVKGVDFLIIRCYQKNINIKKNDVVTFLFTDKSIIHLPLESDGTRNEKTQDGIIIESFSKMTQTDMETFRTKRFLNWRIESVRNQKIVHGGITNKVDLAQIQEDIILMALAYNEVVQSEIPGYKALLERYTEVIDQTNELLGSRKISQDVMDRVWRRDEGKCVMCGSREKLEFDHIIPFSKGGSNTYRNIQLLCENCNRTKSAKIG